MKSNRDSVRKTREAYLIARGQTLEPLGLNRRDKNDTFSGFSSSVCLYFQLYFFGICLVFSIFLFRIVTLVTYL